MRKGHQHTAAPECVGFEEGDNGKMAPRHQRQTNLQLHHSNEDKETQHTPTLSNAVLQKHRDIPDNWIANVRFQWVVDVCTEQKSTSRVPHYPHKGFLTPAPATARYAGPI
jgi:hypothetical protein